MQKSGSLKERIVFLLFTGKQEKARFFSVCQLKAAKYTEFAKEKLTSRLWTQLCLEPLAELHGLFFDTLNLLSS